MESGLTFNQLICEFESRRPRQKIVGSCRQEQEAAQSNLVQSTSNKHKTKSKIGNRKSAIFHVGCSANRQSAALWPQRLRVQLPSAHPKNLRIAELRDCGLKREFGTVAERLGTWLSTKPMTVRVRSVPPVFKSGCGVTLASESWALVVTVRLCPPRPKHRWST